MVREQQPALKVARNLYARVALNPKAEVWYSQSLDNSLASYDFTAIMAMPYMEQAADPAAFFRDSSQRRRAPRRHEAGGLRAADGGLARRQPADPQPRSWPTRSAPLRAWACSTSATTPTCCSAITRIRGVMQAGARRQARTLPSRAESAPRDRSARHCVARPARLRLLLPAVHVLPVDDGGGAVLLAVRAPRAALGPPARAPGHAAGQRPHPLLQRGGQRRGDHRASARADYPEFEVIAINDGSADDTGEVLDALAAQHPRLRVVHLAQNQGKAMALQAGALLARARDPVCIDGDALLDPQAAHWMVRHFIESRDVAAVTGNPRIRNRSTLLGRVQVGEFSLDRRPDQAGAADLRPDFHRQRA